MLILVHVAATAIGYGLVEEQGALDELWMMITEMPGMVTATIATVLLVLVGVSCVRAVRRRLPYGPWWVLHLTVYVAVVLGFAHQIETGDDFVGRPTAAAIWKGIVIAVLAAVAWWRIARPLADAWARRTRVASATREGGGISIWLEGDGAGRPGLRGGGFVLVRFLTRGLWTTARPYSITEVGEGDRIRLVVRLRGSGTARSSACGRGRARSSKGRSAISIASRCTPGAPVLLVGAGAGMTPLRPLAADLAAGGHDVVVVHRATSAEQQVLAPDLRALSDQGLVVLHDLVGDRATLGHDPLAERRAAAARPGRREPRGRHLHAARAHRADRPCGAGARHRARASARGGLRAVTPRMRHLAVWVARARRVGRRRRRPGARVRGRAAAGHGRRRRRTADRAGARTTTVTRTVVVTTPATTQRTRPAASRRRRRPPRPRPRRPPRSASATESEQRDRGAGGDP